MNIHVKVTNIHALVGLGSFTHFLTKTKKKLLKFQHARFLNCTRMSSERLESSEAMAPTYVSSGVIPETAVGATIAEQVAVELVTFGV